LDPALCTHLENSFVQSQLYGIRWSRLMLGREFSVTAEHLYKLWDFIFASCYDAETSSADELLDDDAPPNVYSVLADVRMRGFHKRTNKENKQRAASASSSTSSSSSSSAAGVKFTYVCTPLLGSLADFMLAMFLQVSTALRER
jgi:hypothetical protein